MTTAQNTMLQSVQNVQTIQYELKDKDKMQVLFHLSKSAI